MKALWIAALSKKYNFRHIYNPKFYRCHGKKVKRNK